MAKKLPEIDPRTFIPLRWEDRRSPVPSHQFGPFADAGKPVLATGVCDDVLTRPTERAGMVMNVVVRTATDPFHITIFHASSYHGMQYQRGRRLTIWGVPKWEDKWVFYAPEIVPPEEAGRILPIYKKPQGISEARLRGHVQARAMEAAESLIDEVPDEVLRARGLPSIREALLAIHCPSDRLADRADLLRLAYREVYEIKDAIGKVERKAGPVLDADLTDYYAGLPFALTGDQLKAIADIQRDLASGKAMRRLVLGDVGSGKTEVALAAAAVALRCGHRVLVLEPTTVLASQLYDKFSERFGAEIVSFQTGKKKTGKSLIVVGTHALMNTSFIGVGLVIVDEQHKFGVFQKQKLLGEHHVLELSATPIPRTVSLILHGALHVSELRERPYARDVETHVLTRADKDVIMRHVWQLVQQAKKVLIIYPLVRENDKSAYKSVEGAVRVWETLCPGKVIWVHGQLDQKQEVVDDFRRKGDKQILVASSLIENGIDIPEATMLVVGGAERFGLSQLHQLRGRIGRRGDKSYCLLVCVNEDARERVAAMERISDGFELAELDADLRGWGEVFSPKQSGHCFNLPDIELYKTVIPWVAEDWHPRQEETDYVQNRRGMPCTEAAVVSG